MPGEFGTIDGLTARLHGNGQDRRGIPDFVNLLSNEHKGSLRPTPFLRLTLTIFERLAKLGGLEFEDLGLSGAGLALVLKLRAEYLELPGLNLEELGLLTGELLLVGDLPLNGSDFPGLLAEREIREDRGGDRADAEERGEDGGQLDGEDLGHGGSLEVTAPYAMHASGGVR